MSIRTVSINCDVDVTYNVLPIVALFTVLIVSIFASPLTVVVAICKSLVA